MITDVKDTHINIIFTENDFELKAIEPNNLSREEQFLYNKYINGKGSFLLELAFGDYKEISLSVGFLRFVSKVFIDNILKDPGLKLYLKPKMVELQDEIMLQIVENKPYAIGYENISVQWVKTIISLLNNEYISECESSGKKPAMFISQRNDKLVIPSRIYFHLVENKQREELPFAFLATYTTILDDEVKHFPLKNALSEMKDKKEEMSSLTKNLESIAQKSSFVNHLLQTGDIFYPIKFSEEEAYCFLKETELYEENGIICRIPQWYNDRNCVIKVSPEEKKEYQDAFFNQRIINAFVPQMVYMGIPITIQEARLLLERKEGLEIVKGRWVENNHRLLEELINEYETLSEEGVSLIDILKNKSGLGLNSNSNNDISIEVTREDFLSEYIKKIFERAENTTVPNKFKNVLRHYQLDAFKWLYSLNKMGMGACLADDMGLGKTVEVLSFLEKNKEEGASKNLIIVPATLIDNWKHEVDKFASDMDIFVLRGYNEPVNDSVKAFITICTYQTAIKSDYINRIEWDVIILDEAQAIKNYYTAQTRKVKTLKAKYKIAMTGTPIENNLLELWSIFDFINPGLLGSKDEFIKLYKKLRLNPEGYKEIKALIDPFVLRRVKTDKQIISDLPDKNELDIKISLTKEQIVLYKKVVDVMNANIKRLKDRKEEKIIVMTSIMKLKQVCNHPSQYYSDQEYDFDQSGKFIELKRICETISEKNEKVLVFTQFKEVIPALDKLLGDVFGVKGYCIDGDTSMNKRDQYVQSFQAGDKPYMVLSLKTAGVGLNLTAAQNVIHFDRWWNPAVENQATDRAYRIGQKKDVTVYRFISANTIEEVISDMLKEKQKMADLIINDLEGNVLNKLSTEEIMSAVQYRGFYED